MTAESLPNSFRVLVARTIGTKPLNFAREKSQAISTKVQRNQYADVGQCLPLALVQLPPTTNIKKITRGVGQCSKSDTRRWGDRELKNIHPTLATHCTEINHPPTPKPKPKQCPKVGRQLCRHLEEARQTPNTWFRMRTQPSLNQTNLTSPGN